MTIIFTYDPRSGQIQVKKGQNLKPKNFFLKHTYLLWYCLRIPKKSFVLMFDNWKCQKSRFKKVTSAPLHGFWSIAQPKIKILAGNFVHLLLVHSSILYIPGFEIPLKNDFVGINFLKK